MIAITINTNHAVATLAPELTHLCVIGVRTLTHELAASGERWERSAANTSTRTTSSCARKDTRQDDKYSARYDARDAGRVRCAWTRLVLALPCEGTLVWPLAAYHRPPEEPGSPAVRDGLRGSRAGGGRMFLFMHMLH